MDSTWKRGPAAIAMAAALLIGLTTFEVDARGRDGGGAAPGEANQVHYDKETYTAQDAHDAETDVAFLGARVTFEGIADGIVNYILAIARYRPDVAAQMLNNESVRGTGCDGGKACDLDGAETEALMSFLERMAKRLRNEAEAAERFESDTQETSARYAMNYLEWLIDILGDWWDEE